MVDEDAIADLFAAFGPVAVKRMFGGAGLYADGLMFAIWASDTCYLKADAALAGDLKARGSVPFSYLAKGVERTMGGFWSVPEDALDDADDLAGLARRALFVAHAAQDARSRPASGEPAAGKTVTKEKAATKKKAVSKDRPAAKSKSAPARGGSAR